MQAQKQAYSAQFYEAQELLPEALDAEASQEQHPGNSARVSEEGDSTAREMEIHRRSLLYEQLRVESVADDENFDWQR